jgi:YggT family protein
LVYWPTEPLLIPTRKLIPPIGGVDITPIIWFGLVSLGRELLLGQQGLLRMI